jgi:radical SAM superfamily enzyme YgiQ (UPF0313 family)
MNARRDVVCERAFLPDKGDAASYAKAGSGLVSMESQRPLQEFDVVAFTISFENDVLNLKRMFELAKMPMRKSERGENFPKIIAGGAALTINPRSVSDIFDEVFVGEFEEKYLRMERDLDSFKTQTVIHCRDAEFSDMHLIEVTRGCPRACKFCAVPSAYAPFRMRSASSIAAMVDDGLKFRNKFGLIGADVLSHPEFVDIANYIHSKGATFSPSSVRADAVDEKKALLLALSGHRSVALGVETGSERLREEIGKKISDQRMLDAIATLARCGISRLRLYFMVGLPGETDDDVRAIADFAARALAAARSSAKKGSSSSVDLTLTPFVPKPGTQFRTKAFAGVAELKRRQRMVADGLRRLPIKVRCDSPAEAAIEHSISKAPNTKSIENLILSQ